ncbi:AMP-binding protein [Sphingopyxis kveilinensis]|uniref:AMP-binding protein n=1 Tax=Sphingopyxis kveilinensis TaxID=3114367 RepID=UPI0030CDBA8B
MGLAALLRRNAQTRADHPAFVFGARRTSWGTLLDRARRLAAVFSDQGVRPGDRIALLMATSDRYFEAIHAVVWAGAIAVPMNIRLTPAELVDNLADSAPALLV